MENHWRKFCAPAVLLITMAGAAVAQQTANPAPISDQVFTDWQVTCDAQQPCRMAQTVLQPSTSRAIVQMKVFGSDDPTALLTFPLGILLAPGWSYRIDGGQSVQHPFEICNPDGCHAGVKLTPATLTAFKRGNTLEITFYDAAKTAVTPAMSLDGFTKAWEAVNLP